jgi:hypothetical protein
MRRTGRSVGRQAAMMAKGCPGADQGADCHFWFGLNDMVSEAGSAAGKVGPP